MKTYIVDTYAWIAYFEGNKKFLSEIEQNILETPSIVLAELSKVLLVKKFDGKKMAEILDYVTESSIILELGKEQARRLALRLKVEKIDYIYSSDLERAANTAREISQYHPHTPITFVKDLREGDWGKIAGKLKMDLTGDPQKNPERKDYPTDGVSCTFSRRNCRKYSCSLQPDELCRHCFGYLVLMV